MRLRAGNVTLLLCPGFIIYGANIRKCDTIHIFDKRTKL